MAIGLRPVGDARGRRFAHPQVQDAWAALDCGFAQVADVFEECASEALASFGAAQMAAYIEAARGLGRQLHFVLAGQFATPPIRPRWWRRS